jgi:hypothetical protein
MGATDAGSSRAREPTTGSEKWVLFRHIREKKWLDGTEARRLDAADEQARCVDGIETIEDKLLHVIARMIDPL